MYLSKLKIKHYRKFNEEENEIRFVASKSVNGSPSAEFNSIDVASNTTLIIGKNNAGKSTVINALETLIGNTKYSSNDFNFSYIKSYFCEKKYRNDFKGPFIEFELTIQLEPESDDRIENLIPFILIQDVTDYEISITARYEVVEFSAFKETAEKIISNQKNENKLFQSYLDVINNSKFQLNFYNVLGNPIDKNFKLSSLIEIECIKANKLKNDHCLSDSFNRIVTYRYDQLFSDKKNEVTSRLDTINDELTDTIKKEHQDILTDVLSNLIRKNRIGVSLRSDITFDKLMQDLISYEYLDNDSSVPENQFGLGYTNLVMIIASIMNYIEKYHDNAFNSKINLISIEEPETFMHPQMQELFIKNIEDAIKILLEKRRKNVNFQLLITTHSSHILNSKIDSTNGFNNICYLLENRPDTSAINLCNELITPTENQEGNNEFLFLKKHIKYKVSELFFCDAAIFVEGDAEATLLPYYIENDKDLNLSYISVFNVGGAHAYLYRNLIKELKIPVLLVTDLDIKRETDDYSNVTDINNKETTNKNLSVLFGTKSIIEIINKPQNVEPNLFIAYQKEIESIYPTSFEESLILENYSNKVLNSTLKEVKPGIYKKIVGIDDSINTDKNKYYSASWQNKLSNAKGNFASILLYNILISEGEDLPVLPSYIIDGFEWLKKQLGVTEDAAE